MITKTLGVLIVQSFNTGATADAGLDDVLFKGIGRYWTNQRPKMTEEEVLTGYNSSKMTSPRARALAMHVS
jgi:hypothetical protein